MGKIRLALKPVDMTRELMVDLEKKGVIHRLAPHNDDLDMPKGKGGCKSIYESDPVYGGHKLIAVTINDCDFKAFATHPDNEEFLLIGDPDTIPMYLALSFLTADELAAKARAGKLAPEDFLAVRVRYNDPETSFFVMHKGIPHGEGILDVPGKPPSFYVTESTNLPNVLCDLGPYSLSVDAGMGG